MQSFRFLIPLALSLIHTGTPAMEPARLGTLEVTEVWSRAMPPVSATGAAYLSVRNTGETQARLVSATADIAPRVELHAHTNDGGVMRMREVEAVTIHPGETVTLAPGGLHVMLIDLQRPLVAGESFGLTLRFEGAGEISLTVPVQPAGHTGHPMPRGHGAHRHGSSQ